MGKLVIKNIKLTCPECETKFTLRTKPKRAHFNEYFRRKLSWKGQEEQVLRRCQYNP